MKPIIFALCALFFLPAHGAGFVNMVCGGRYAVGAEALIGRPCNDDPYFAIVGPSAASEPEGSEKAINPAYDIGWMVWGRLEMCGWQRIALGWTHFDTSASRHLSAVANEAQIWLTDGSPVTGGEVTGRHHWRYDAAHVATDYRIFNWCPFQLYIGGGIAWADIAFSSRTTADTTTTTTSRTWGVGPEVVLAARYSFVGGVSLNLDLNAGLVTGQKWSSQSAIHSESTCHTMPFGTLALNIEKCWRIRDHRLTAHIGWRATHYLSAIQAAPFNLSSATAGASVSL